MRISERDFGQLLQSYLINIFLFGIAIYLYRNTKYYSGWLTPQAQKAMLMIFLAYVVLAVPSELILSPEKRRIEGKGLIALRALMNFLRNAWSYLPHYPLEKSSPPTMTKYEKTCILFLLVKFFYLPMMVNFAFGNWGSMLWELGKYNPTASLSDNLLTSVFPFIMMLFLLIDTFIFIFGYAVEYPIFRNEIRSVEPTFFGWFIAVLCYPPFNGVMDNFFIWAPDTYGTLPSLPATYAIRIIALLFHTLYLLPSFALGTKASNLTNRGIVTGGPYAWIRHPAYVGKTFSWWVLSIPFLIQPGSFLIGAFSMGAWTTIYVLRALTEERHLSADPDYIEYCKKVPWRFIPYVI